MDQGNGYGSDDERVGCLQEPSLSWEEIENGKSGQPGLFTFLPTLAERAFLVLARKWHAEVLAIGKNTRIPRSVDILTLSCLLLSVEWGHDFTEVAWWQIHGNLNAAAAHHDELPGGRGWVIEPNPTGETAATYRGVSWHDQLSWELCLVPSMVVLPPDTAAVEKLTVNLDHHNSNIRCWMMEIGWIARPWLATTKSVPRLLKNLADTLLDAFEAAGLAAALVSTADEFWTLARDFKPSDDRFAEQYADRLKFVEENGILAMQTPFWKLDAQCRKVIADAVLGLRLVPPGK